MQRQAKHQDRLPIASEQMLQSPSVKLNSIFSGSSLADQPAYTMQVPRIYCKDSQAVSLNSQKTMSCEMGKMGSQPTIVIVTPS